MVGLARPIEAATSWSRMRSEVPGADGRNSTKDPIARTRAGDASREQKDGRASAAVGHVWNGKGMQNAMREHPHHADAVAAAGTKSMNFVNRHWNSRERKRCSPRCDEHPENGDPDQCRRYLPRISRHPNRAGSCEGDGVLRAILGRPTRCF